MINPVTFVNWNGFIIVISVIMYIVKTQKAIRPGNEATWERPFLAFTAPSMA